MEFDSQFSQFACINQTVAHWAKFSPPSFRDEYYAIYIFPTTVSGLARRLGCKSLSLSPSCLHHVAFKDINCSEHHSAIIRLLCPIKQFVAEEIRKIRLIQEAQGCLLRITFPASRVA